MVASAMSRASSAIPAATRNPRENPVARACAVSWAGDATVHVLICATAEHRLQHGNRWFLFGGDQVGDLLRLVDLDKVPGVVEQVQLAVGEQRGEVASDPGVE